MNLYLITRTDKVGWNEYDSFVACADTEDEALAMSPDDHDDYEEAWTTRENLKIKLVGTASPGMSKGSVLASYDAG